MLYGRDILSIGDVKDPLQSKELKRMVLGSIESNSDSGLVVIRGESKERNGGNKMKSRSKLKSRGPRCFHYKELRHIRCDCPQRKNGKEKKESDGKANVSIVHENFNEGKLKGNDVLTVSISNSLDTWMMDTGASYHMTFNKHRFHSFKEWHSTMMLGDDERLPIMVSGSLQIKMYDGIVRTFDAWYVLGVRKNLVSLGALDKQGYKFAGGDGQIKVMKSSMIVIKDKLQHGFYTLLGNTIMGTMVVSSA